MPLNPSGPISIGGSTVGQSINLELGRAATATSSLNETAFRNLAGVPSGAISLSNFYGKANAFLFSITSNNNNVNLRSAAVSAGWNQSTQVIATINSGVVIGSASTGSPALVIDGAWPGGVQLINNGSIVGLGGNGGAGGNAQGGFSGGTFYANPGAVGLGGGTALSVSVATSITNNGTVAGGGGGGGGGGGAVSQSKGNNSSGGSGGGGGRTNNINSSGGAFGTTTNSGPKYNGIAGSAGTFAGAGAGGPQVTQAGVTGGAGGPGGGWGSTGTKGNNGSGNTISGAGGNGGAAGPATSGNANITWLATGTRLGPLN